MLFVAFYFVMQLQDDSAMGWAPVSGAEGRQLEPAAPTGTIH
jgi:hypothetical protein